MQDTKELASFVPFLNFHKRFGFLELPNTSSIDLMLYTNKVVKTIHDGDKVLSTINKRCSHRPTNITMNHYKI